jgi:hypothetical protein
VDSFRPRSTREALHLEITSYTTEVITSTLVEVVVVVVVIVVVVVVKGEGGLGLDLKEKSIVRGKR